MKKQILIILLGLGVVFSACTTSYDKLLSGTDVSKKYEYALKYFNEKKYKRAIELFDNLNLAVQGTPQEDTVAFYHGLSTYRWKDYQSAETILAKFIEVYPRSAFTEKGAYYRVKCLYESTYRYELDPTPTKKALAIMSEFMYNYPNSEYIPECKEMMTDLVGRMEKKSFESAKLYYTMQDYKASRYALKNVLKENAENQYREEILYYTAMSSYKYAYNSIHQRQKERYMDFVDDYYLFISEYPESKFRDELDDCFEKASKYTKTESVNTNKVE